MSTTHIGGHQRLQDPPKSIVQTSPIHLYTAPGQIGLLSPKLNILLFHLFYLLLLSLLCAVLGLYPRNRRIWGMVLMGATEEKLRGVANLAHDVLG